MSTSLSPPRSKTGAIRTRLRSPRVWVVLLSVIGVSLILFLIIRVQGRVTGTEFSPGHFRARTFEFFEIPLLHLQVTPISRASATPTTATFIRQNGWISVPQGQPDDWQLVSISRGISASVPADAQLLTSALATGVGQNFWRDWSQNHPQQAAVLWPVVQRLAERELYVLVPRLLELADRHAASADFEGPLHAYLRQQYAELVVEARRANRSELAKELLDEALGDYPEAPVLRKLAATPQSADAPSPSTNAAESPPSQVDLP